MKKLLIVSGCSYTDPFYRAYVNNNVNVWPSIVAKELEVDLINFAGEVVQMTGLLIQLWTVFLII